MPLEDWCQCYAMEVWNSWLEFNYRQTRKGQIMSDTIWIHDKESVPSTPRLVLVATKCSQHKQTMTIPARYYNNGGWSTAKWESKMPDEIIAWCELPKYRET